MAKPLPRVLLTGGAGFIGSHLAEALLRRGAHLTILDNLDDFYSPAWKQANLADVQRAGACEFFHADLREPSAVNAAFAQAQPEIVVHLAARAGVRPSIEQPLLYERVNVGGTMVVLEACRSFGVRKLIFGSSSSVYGASSRTPFSEDQNDLWPISPYAATKLASELAAYTYAHLYRLPVVCLRLFTVYGPRQRPDLAIHKFTALVEAGQPVPVYGDGSTGRDYTFVDDIVAGTLAALDYTPAGNGAAFETFNLGNSHPVRLNELLDALGRATGREVRRETLPPQPGDVLLTWADISKARRVLGYNPQTKLEEGLARFVQWYRGAEGRRLELRP